MKHLFTTAALLFSMTAFAQVGINNTSPKATLDITAKTSGTKPEGLIIPQLTGDQIRTATAGAVYGTSQKGLIVYASSADTAPAGATASITAPGYYYFDGTNWQKISTGNTVSTSLASGNILVGSASNVATAVSPTGDVTISNTGATSIGAGKVTNSQMANAAALTVKGNATNAAASPTDIAAGTDGHVLRRSGTALGFGTVATAGIADGAVTAAKLNQMSATSGQVLAWNGTAWTPTANGVSTTLNSGNILVGNASNVATAVTPTGDVTISNTGVTSIGAGKVTNSQMANMAALTVKGNATNAAATPTDIAAGTDGYVLRRSGTALGFGTVDTAGITDGAVTTNKILDATVANADLATGVGGIYKGSGALSGGNTSVDLGTNTLAFTSGATNGTSHFTVDGTTLNVDAVNNRVGIGTAAPIATLDTRTNPGNASPGNGAIAIGETTQTASAAGPGAIRYNTTSKDIQYSDGASWSSLAKSDPYGSFVPVVKLVARKTTVQTLAPNTTANITFPTVVSNPDGGYNALTGIYTVPTGESGLYMVSVACNVGFNNSSSNSFTINVNFNNAPIEMVLKSNIGATSLNVGGAVAYYLTAGQTINISSQTCSSCLTTAYTYNLGVLSITKLSAN